MILLSTDKTCNSLSIVFCLLTSSSRKDIIYLGETNRSRIHRVAWNLIVSENNHIGPLCLNFAELWGVGF